MTAADFTTSTSVPCARPPLHPDVRVAPAERRSDEPQVLAANHVFTRLLLTTSRAGYCDQPDCPSKASTALLWSNTLAPLPSAYHPPGLALTPGTCVAPYELVALLGVGGMGERYGARDTNLHGDVALKTLRSVQDDEAGRRARFVREGRRWRRSTTPTSRRLTVSIKKPLAYRCSSSNSSRA